MKKSIIYTITFSVLLILMLSCKHSSQKNDMLNILEESGVEVPEEMREQSSLTGADIFFPISVVLGLGIIAYIFFKKVSRSKSGIGYAISDMSNNIGSLKEGNKMYNKMSEEEKKRMGKLKKLFGNNSNKFK